MMDSRLYMNRNSCIQRLIYISQNFHVNHSFYHTMRNNIILFYPSYFVKNSRNCEFKSTSIDIFTKFQYLTKISELC